MRGISLMHQSNAAIKPMELGAGEATRASIEAYIKKKQIN